MIDRYLLPSKTRVLSPLAVALARMRISANTLTLSAWLLTPFIVWAIATHHYTTAIVLIVINRLIDGLDGELARLHGATAKGAFLDIVLDYYFYISVPLGFALHAFSGQTGHGIASAFLIGSFVLTSVPFLAYANLVLQKKDEARIKTRNEANDKTRPITYQNLSPTANEKASEKAYKIANPVADSEIDATSDKAQEESQVESQTETKTATKNEMGIKTPDETDGKTLDKTRPIAYQNASPTANEKASEKAYKIANPVADSEIDATGDKAQEESQVESQAETKTATKNEMGIKTRNEGNDETPPITYQNASPTANEKASEKANQTIGSETVSEAREETRGKTHSKAVSEKINDGMGEKLQEKIAKISPQTSASKTPQKAQGYEDKGFYYSGGLIEGSETIAFFLFFCLFPEHYFQSACLLACLCAATGLYRVFLVILK